MEHVLGSAVKSAILASKFASGSANIRGSVVLCAVCRVVGCPAVSLAQIYSLAVMFVPAYAESHVPASAPNARRSLPDNIDRMFAKFGRKMEMFEDELTKAESGLSSSSGEFTKQFRPSPLAGKKNQNLVRVRGNMMMEVQKKITDFRDEVVIPFEENAILLAAYLDNPKIFAPPVLPFELRFDLLYHKCRLVTLQEAVNMQKVMSPHAEALPHVKTLVDGLLMITTEQATDNIKALDLLFAKASSAQLKSLEVELRLVQISFYVVLRALGVKHDLDITASLQQVAKTCNRYRTAAGPYIRSYRLLKSFCDGMEPPRKLFGQETRQYWWKWGRHEVGFLTSCANGHPYSSKTFNGCPECEGKTAQVEPEPVDYSKYLQEDAFLAKMHMRAVS
ncbi:MAG: hypothetical protein FRX48_01114 [Lasallia pustulata]|uniref:Uncharacterized protein n=1 Tax=Lasallia pustulata TaxID=136370 RepID=A0A5M8Q2B8_9LECA|nr:MAG: hypothetical protein FRX48_01114 [Lasallia pustulata]